MDDRFSLDVLSQPGPSSHASKFTAPPSPPGPAGAEHDGAMSADEDLHDADGHSMNPEGLALPADSEKVVKPLTPEALAAFKASQEKAGIVYISRVPPGMRPAKVRHLMSAYGEVGRVYLQQEDPKRAYLRKKFTATKKAHFTEGWVEFKDKRVARSVAGMLNAQPIGGKKGTRWYDDVWTMKYLPKFKWNMLTEQVAHEAAIHAARLRVELSQSRSEQREYLKNVELARVLDKRAQRKKITTGTTQTASEGEPKTREKRPTEERAQSRKRTRTEANGSISREQVDDVLNSIF